MRRLLLTTSILDRVNAELAAELAGDTDGALFAGLVRENSFLRPVGQGWYRCHQMFADVLRTCLRHETPGLVAPLHRTAASWLAGCGLLADAVRHLFAAGDGDEAARLIVRHLAIGQVLGLARARLPVDTGGTRPTNRPPRNRSPRCSRRPSPGPAGTTRRAPGTWSGPPNSSTGCRRERTTASHGAGSPTA